MTNLETYYRDHWIEIEAERMERYEAMFQWRDGQEVLIAPAEVGDGHIVADYGCGPGGLALELARRVGAHGIVIGLDINPAFLERTRRLQSEPVAHLRGFEDQWTYSTPLTVADACDWVHYANQHLHL